MPAPPSSAPSTRGRRGWEAGKSSASGSADRLLERPADHFLGGLVEEEDPHLAAQEDDPVLELVDHVLHLGLLGERGEAVGVHLPTEPLELGGQLLELVTASPPPARR